MNIIYYIIFLISISFLTNLIIIKMKKLKLQSKNEFKKT